MLTGPPPERINDKLLMLGTAPYPIYFVQGGSATTVFEGGVGAMGPLVSEQIGQVDIDPESVDQIVITHAHPDHVMAVPLLRRLFPRAAVLASETAAKTLANEKAVSFFCRIDAALTESLTRAGFIRPEHHPPPLNEKQIAVDRVIDAGQKIEVGGEMAFDVLPTPGHSDCSLSFFDPQEGILFVSDATGYYLPESDYWWPDYFVDYAVYLDSLRRLAGLGAEVLCLSHNAVFQGAEEVEDYFGRAIEATEAYHRRIVEQARGGKPARQLAEELGAEVHDKAPLLPLDFFQKNCALLVKQSLRHEGMESP